MPGLEDGRTEAPGDGDAARLVVVGALGDSLPATEGFLVSMRLRCRGFRTVNLGTGVTLPGALAALVRHPRAEALLLAGGPGAPLARELTGLRRWCAAGGVRRPVFVGGSGDGAWRLPGPAAVALRELGVAAVLADLADAAFLLPRRAAPSPAGRAGPGAGTAGGPAAAWAAGDRATGHRG
ncbi:hypothetical protein [Streptomyces sp. JJ36]|uniref:hypothetical protein n=1 Tax=Streptomyces sp. JJ36 TaxID=2736645 RepID=UPI001F210C31|nr:hypothetical protein [Streptomyces sp. JJ36]MCF6524518.1 hypothetical protein [Streptomyces sp. JJ36]